MEPLGDLAGMIVDFFVDLRDSWRDRRERKRAEKEGRRNNEAPPSG